MNKILNNEERSKYKEIVRKTRNVDEKVRLCVILAYDMGHEVPEIAEIMQISESSAYKYIKEYIDEHKVANAPKLGASCKLSVSQEIELISHLHEVTYLSAKQICSYVKKTYGVIYTKHGMSKWLIRNGFVYKKPKSVPGKLDTQKQEAFVAEYEELKANLGEDEVIMFMDAVHPEYQSQATYGWIARGETKTIATTNKQFRVHFNGAIELSTMRVFTQEYETIDADSVISFYKNLERLTTYKTIHIICDNGRSNKNKALNAYLAQSNKIKVHYLPSYSPNLNSIERLWKIMREHVCYNKYYPTFELFSTEIRNFFSETIPKISDILRARINDKFQIIHHNPVQLSS